MKQVIVFLIFAYANMSVAAQNYNIGSTRFAINDPTRSNRKIKLIVYYPSGYAGKNVRIADGTNKFPVICFGHGFVMPVKQYENLWRGLVPEGYIFVLPSTETGIAPSHTELAYDLSYALDYFKSLGSDKTSVFYNRIDTTNCVMGHSMGGGAAAFASGLNGRINTLVTFGMYTSVPASIEAARETTIPSLIFSGSNDCITPPEEHQIPFFKNLKSRSKLFISITGGSHCQMAMKYKLCRWGEKTCNPGPSVSGEVQHEILLKYLLPFLNYHLKGDTSANHTLFEMIRKDRRVTFRTGG